MIRKKLLLATIREGDYTHAGETNAIHIAMNNIEKKDDQTLLDVGCGLGGTAHYINQHGWGKVTGIDIDPEVINYAKAKYHNIDFLLCPAATVNEVCQQNYFSIIYLFNAYFSFLNQEKCLKTLATMGKEQSTLILFDYSCYGDYLNENPFFDKQDQFFNPINLLTIETLLHTCNWQISKMIDLTSLYIIWYEQIINKIDNKSAMLNKAFGQKTFNKVYQDFLKVLRLLKSNQLGGSLIYAKKIS